MLLSIAGDPLTLYESDLWWATELQSLVQRNAVYRRPKAPSAPGQAQIPLPAPPALEQQPLLWTSSTPVISITTTLGIVRVQTGDAAAFDAEMPEAAPHNQSWRAAPADRTPAPTAPANASLSARALTAAATPVPRLALELAPASAGPPRVSAVIAVGAAALLLLVVGTTFLLLYYCGRRSSGAHLAGASTNPALAYVSGIPISYSWHIEEHLPRSCGYDCAISKPVSSGRTVRFQVQVEGPLSGIPLTSPLSRKPCVLYSAGVSSPSFEGLNPMSVAYAADSQAFVVSLLEAPHVRIEVRGDEVSLFEMSEGFLSQRAKFNSVPNHWQEFALSRRLSATYHSPPASRLYSEDPVLEFQECALHVGAHLTCVGELRRREDGVLTVHAWVPHVGGAATAGKRVGKAPQEEPHTLTPGGPPLARKILASDKPDLILLHQDRCVLAKLWANLPSRRVWQHFWGTRGASGRRPPAGPDHADASKPSPTTSVIAALGHRASALLACKRPQPAQQ